ncbi:MAG: hypothetical protein RSA94_05855 [Mucinivorans sp.]
MRFFLPVIVSAFFSLCGWGQALRVGFYNVENLFDTINQVSLDDGDFTPEGSKAWNGAKYEAKKKALANAISLFNPDVLGVCEVENYVVVQDLAQCTERLRGVVHYDSHDSRGIDVALLFDTSLMCLVASEPIFVGTIRRNLLRADFLVHSLGQVSWPLTIFVAHLPSKLGGKGAALRRELALRVIDSLAGGVRYAVVVGDMNDSPRDQGVLYNCAYAPFERGLGSYAYRDVWNMLDQILITRTLLPFCGGEQHVVHRSELLTLGGRWSSYPRRGEVSDHLPIFMDFKFQ